MPNLEERYHGCMFGLAAGDALGTTLEFERPGSFEPVTTISGGGPFDLLPGQWTDDMSMAMCLAESLIECGDFDAEDQMARYVAWWRSGYLSCTGSCFDIGNTVCNALRKYEKTGEPYAGSDDPQSGGNGSIMRLAPIPLFYADNPADAILYAAKSSKTTHAAPEAVDACRYLAGLMVGALQGKSKDELLSAGFCPVNGLWDDEPLAPNIHEIAQGSFKHRNPPEIQGTGYVVRSLEAALWAFYNSSTYKEGALSAVNLGQDADTTGAVYGQLAGAYYGLKSIPTEWRDVIAMSDTILEFADGLMNINGDQ